VGALFFKSTATVTPREKVKTGNVVVAYDNGDDFTIECDISEDTPQRAYMDFGIELKNPAYIMVELEDAETLHVGDLVTKGDRSYLIQTGSIIKDRSGGVCDYAEFLAQRTK
jgi:hypothetical protein